MNGLVARSSAIVVGTVASPAARAARNRNLERLADYLEREAR